MINFMKTIVVGEDYSMPWKFAGIVIGALLGIVVVLYVRMPFFLSLPLQIALLLVGGKIGERIGSSKQNMNKEQSWVVVGVVIGGLAAVVAKLTMPLSASASLVLGPILLVAGAVAGKFIGRSRV